MDKEVGIPFEESAIPAEDREPSELLGEYLERARENGRKLIGLRKRMKEIEGRIGEETRRYDESVENAKDSNERIRAIMDYDKTVSGFSNEIKEKRIEMRRLVLENHVLLKDIDMLEDKIKEEAMDKLEKEWFEEGDKLLETWAESAREKIKENAEKRKEGESIGVAEEEVDDGMDEWADKGYEIIEERVDREAA